MAFIKCLFGKMVLFFYSFLLYIYLFLFLFFSYCTIGSLGLEDGHGHRHGMDCALEGVSLLGILFLEMGFWKCVFLALCMLHT